MHHYDRLDRASLWLDTDTQTASLTSLPCLSLLQHLAHLFDRPPNPARSPLHHLETLLQLRDEHFVALHRIEVLLLLLQEPALAGSHQLRLLRLLLGTWATGRTRT